MAEQQGPGTEASASKEQRKPYEKPQIVSEPIYETVALACGKLPGQGGTCIGAPHRS